MPGRRSGGWLLAAGVAAGITGALSWAVHSARGWGPQVPGTPLPSLGGEVLFIDIAEIVRRGPPRLVVARFSRPVDLVPHHYAAAGLEAPLTVEAWAERLGAQVVFNAGQFDTDRQHLGWLKGDGIWINTRRKREWLGLLLSGPMAAGPFAQVVDLQVARPEIVDGYRHVLQSMMLVDETSRVRVRHSERAACRTVVAQDRRGRLLVMATEGAVTLWELAAWLPRSDLEVARAMNLDGGVESQLAILTPELSLTFYGQYGADSTVLGGRRVMRAPLPAVVAVWPQGGRRPATG